MKNDDRIDIRLPAELKQQLKDYCEERCMSVNKYLVKIIKENIKGDD